MPIAGEDSENRNVIHCLWEGKWYNHSPSNQAIGLPGMYLADFKTCAYTKYLHINVYRSFINNHKTLETSKMSFNKGMDKQTVEIPRNAILFSDK